MNMKMILFIISILLPLGTLSAYADTGKATSVITVGSIDKVEPLYILDEKKIKAAAFQTIDPKSILQVNVMKPEAGIKKYGPQAKNGVIIVVTKKFAVKAYKQRLSALLDEYKKYLKEHHNDDRLSFVINGVAYRSSSFERTGKLYNIFSDDAAYLNFELSFTTGLDDILTSVIIDSKTN
jgi:hypothetical protein